MDTRKLKNKKAIITGANRSIGKGIALAFAEQGADVVISYRSDEKGANSVIEIIQKKYGCLGKSLYADFSETSNVECFFESALDFLGDIDILVNNAAGYSTTPFLDLTIEEFERLLKIGLSTSMLLTQLAAKHMIKKEISGTIVNISSISGNRPYTNRVAHSTAKAALNMLTQSTALELAPYNIRVNAIAPGTTPYDESTIHDHSVRMSIPLKRAGTPRDVANAAVYLASEDASWITGQILTMDGGQSLSF
jgi:NAD(P)-dependent dehydrogenase (short-subunit alcohol dehydrogenase family)